MNLNSKQEEAKNKIDWPLLIIAGAGSWKTATLTARVEYMINEKEIPASNIMMVTFTNKAAKEMRERVAKTLWVETPRNMYSKHSFPLVWTFHGIWIFILKEVLNKYPSEELNIWLKKDFVIYDESDKLSVLKWIIKNDLNLEEKEYPARQIGFFISNAKNALISAKAYEAEVDSAIKEVVYSAYLKYEERLRQNNAMDFDDILIKTLNLLKIPKILSIYQDRYKYLMVDEYQDTNSSQYHIVKLLASRYHNLAVVWDDSQSIYSWRGADMTNIINFKKDYRDALVIKLEQNYRSTKTIIAWANSVIKNNNSWIKKELWTDNISGEKIKYLEAPDDRTEASIIAENIKEYTNNGKYWDNLILYRTNAQSRQIEEAFMMKNIPYRVVWGLKFYDRKEVKDMLGYLRVIHNIDDVVSMKRIINTPTRKIWAKSIEHLDNYREQFWLNYPTIIANIDEVEELKPAARASLISFGKIFNNLCNASKELIVWDLIAKIIKEISYEDYLKTNFSQEEYESKKDNLEELKNVASEYNWMDSRESLSLFLEEVALITDMDVKDEREDYVTLMTIHTSKWLEQKRVFLTWVEENIFPSFRSVSDNYALEEERRLMYVAMTRAKEELIISRAKERFHFWDYVRNMPSRFLKEIDPATIEDYVIKWDKWFFGNKISNPINLLNWEGTWQEWKRIFKPKVNNDVSQFNMWDRVGHHKFWNWIIVSLNWDLAEIAFTWKWIKKMNIKIAPIKKL